MAGQRQEPHGGAQHLTNCILTEAVAAHKQPDPAADKWAAAIDAWHRGKYSEAAANARDASHCAVDPALRERCTEAAVMATAYAEAEARLGLADAAAFGAGLADCRFQAQRRRLMEPDDPGSSEARTTMVCEPERPEEPFSPIPAEPCQDPSLCEPSHSNPGSDFSHGHSPAGCCLFQLPWPFGSRRRKASRQRSPTA